MLVSWLAGGAGVVCAALVLQWLRRRSRKGAGASAPEHFHAAIEQSSDGVLFVDAATLAIVDANPALLRTLGFTIDRIARAEARAGFHG